MEKGHIVVITGGPGLGKSYLVKKLTQHYDCPAILEGEESDFPERIKENIAQNKRNLELCLYFRNKTVEEYIKAIKIKKQNQVVILDTFWQTNDVYIDEWIKDDFEKKLLCQMSQLDQYFLSLPDLILCLTASGEIVKKFMKKRNRAFEQSDEMLNRYNAITLAHDSFFKEKDMPNTFFVDRTNLDFDKKNDLQFITNIIDKKINPK